MATRLSGKCKKCRFVNTCDHKRLEAMAELPWPPAQAEMTAPVLAPVIAPVIAPVLRDTSTVTIHIDASTTVEIEREAIREQIEKVFKVCAFNNFGI